MNNFDDLFALREALREVIRADNSLVEAVLRPLSKGTPRAQPPSGTSKPETAMSGAHSDSSNGIPAPTASYTGQAVVPEIDQESDLPAAAHKKLRPLRGAFQRWIEAPIDARFKHILERLPTRLNEYGYDPVGFDPEALKWAMLFASWLYKYYFRVDLQGVHHVPPGRCMMIGNHTGQIPLDGTMLGLGLLLEADPPRAPRAMAERWVSTLPFISTLFTRWGAILGSPDNCRYLLEREECIIVFPEGARGINKPWWQRYQLTPFGLGFMRLALETDTPIVPFAVVGAEEQYPFVFNLKFLAKLVGAPAVPITPLVMLFGLPGAIPLPTRYHIYITEPMRFSGDPQDEDQVIERKVREVRHRIKGTITYGLKARRHWFA